MPQPQPTAQQQAIATNMQNWAMNQLHAPDGERHLSPLYKARQDFEAQLRDTLTKNNPTLKNDSAALDARVAKDMEDLDKQVVTRISLGGQIGGDAGTFKEQLKQRQDMVTNQVNTLAGSYMGGMGGGFLGMLFPFLGPLFKKIGAWLSDMFSGRSAEERSRENTAAGIAVGINNPLTVNGQELQPINVDGVDFRLDAAGQGTLFNQTSKVDFNQPIALNPVQPEPHTTTPNNNNALPAAQPAGPLPFPKLADQENWTALDDTISADPATRTAQVQELIRTGAIRKNPNNDKYEAHDAGVVEYLNSNTQIPGKKGKSWAAGPGND